MPEKSMKEKLAAGELVLCMNLRLARSVDIAMVAKAGGYDALYVDMQHAPYSIETTSTICAAALGIGILVRRVGFQAAGAASGAVLAAFHHGAWVPTSTLGWGNSRRRASRAGARSVDRLG